MNEKNLIAFFELVDKDLVLRIKPIFQVMEDRGHEILEVWILKSVIWEL